MKVRPTAGPMACIEDKIGTVVANKTRSRPEIMAIDMAVVGTATIEKTQSSNTILVPVGIVTGKMIGHTRALPLITMITGVLQGTTAASFHERKRRPRRHTLCGIYHTVATQTNSVAIPRNLLRLLRTTISGAIIVRTSTITAVAGTTAPGQMR